jgi:hypothetical protein
MWYTARMENEKKTGSTAAENLGHLFAHVQDGVDFFVEMGFKGLKALGKDTKEPVKEDDSHPALQTAKKAGKGAVRFLGEAGDAFYTKYQQLKSERDKKGS